MMFGCWPIVGFVAAMVAAASSSANGCSCWPSRPPCQAAWSADAIFSGTVRAIDVREEETSRGKRMLATVVRFEVEQRFLNVPSGPVEVVTEGYSTCSYAFRRGEKYLVYASRLDDGRLTTTICARTRPLADATEDLQYLSALPAVGTGARVYGRITEWVHHPADSVAVDHGPLENIVVGIHSAGRWHDVLTDRDGRYELRGVPPGPVSISVAAPFGFVAENPMEFNVTDLRGCIAADFALRAESAAYGVVVDEAGRPLSGILVDAVAAELAAYKPEAIFEPAKTDERGRFSFHSLPPGAYVFGVNVTKGRYKPQVGPTTFLPGTPVVTDAAVVELEAGIRSDLGVMRLISR